MLVILIRLQLCLLFNKFIGFESNYLLGLNKKDIFLKKGLYNLRFVNKKLEDSTNREVTLSSLNKTKLLSELEEDLKPSNPKVKISKFRLSNSEKNSDQLTVNLKQVLVGKLLGDAHMRKSNISESSKSNARIIFLQSVEQSELIYKLYELFKEFTVSPPKVNSSFIK
uniref:Homing endonuclease LAGLIDADG domain-containing protein n=1 Tax=Mutinus fleischeri TaxID=2218478 RepID=A0A8K1RBV3_9AGAM|nr:hypothetical protein [Mutinus fleischeri]